MALMEKEAVKILMDRYEISKKEAIINWRCHLDERRSTATNVVTGRRDPNIKIHFKNGEEYLTYLRDLEGR